MDVHEGIAPAFESSLVLLPHLLHGKMRSFYMRFIFVDSASQVTICKERPAATTCSIVNVPAEEAHESQKHQTNKLMDWFLIEKSKFPSPSFYMSIPSFPPCAFLALPLNKQIYSYLERAFRDRLKACQEHIIYPFAT